jgi:hypothetical protein
MLGSSETGRSASGWKIHCSTSIVWNISQKAKKELCWVPCKNTFLSIMDGRGREGLREYTFGLKDKNATIYYYNLQIVKHVTIYFIFFSQEILLI